MVLTPQHGVKVRLSCVDPTPLKLAVLIFSDKLIWIAGLRPYANSRHRGRHRLYLLSLLYHILYMWLPWIGSTVHTSSRLNHQ
ncbi:hypothetical protein BDR04DRAFT_1108058 [Suillus decipiens]|nr:hypothetical protein BDR04DRAFT_1108058 [Suillus decipiens]